MKKVIELPCATRRLPGNPWRRWQVNQVSPCVLFELIDTYNTRGFQVQYFTLYPSRVHGWLCGSAKGIFQINGIYINYIYAKNVTCCLSGIQIYLGVPSFYLLDLATLPIGISWQCLLKQGHTMWNTLGWGQGCYQQCHNAQDVPSVSRFQGQ